MTQPAPLRLAALLFVLTAFVQPGAGLAAERAVRIDGGARPIDGKLTEPAGAASAAVLLLHGFNGHMDEVGNLFADLARVLAERGIASLRINFNGEGPQAGFRVTSTLESRLRESQLAFEFLRAAIPVERYGAVGFSLGGLTTMAVIGEHPDWFDSVVLWSAADRLALERDDEFAEAARAALRDGEAKVSTWADITLTRDFLASFVAVDTSDALARYDGSLLTIRGTEDFLPMEDPAWLSVTPAADKAFFLLGGADHIFNVLAEPRTDHGQRVIAATAAWLERTLLDAPGG